MISFKSFQPSPKMSLKSLVTKIKIENEQSNQTLIAPNKEHKGVYFDAKNKILPSEFGDSTTEVVSLPMIQGPGKFSYC